MAICPRPRSSKSRLRSSNIVLGHIKSSLNNAGPSGNSIVCLKVVAPNSLQPTVTGLPGYYDQPLLCKPRSLPATHTHTQWCRGNLRLCRGSQRAKKGLENMEDETSHTQPYPSPFFTSSSHCPLSETAGPSSSRQGK